MSSPYLDCPECDGVMYANVICAHCQIPSHSEHEMRLAVDAARQAGFKEAREMAADRLKSAADAYEKDAEECRRVMEEERADRRVFVSMTLRHQETNIRAMQPRDGGE